MAGSFFAVLFRRLFRGFFARLRVAVYFACVFAFLSLVALRALKAQVGEAARALGGQLVELPQVSGHVETVELNGAHVHHARVWTTASVEEVLDRFEDHCKRNPGPLGEVLKQVAAKDPALFDKKVPAGAFRHAVIRNESSSDGVIICFVDDRGTGLEGIDEMLSRLTETGDLAELGQFRYVYAERQKDGRTHVVSMRTEGSLNVSRMFPATGDASGSDSRVLPRPPGSRRTLSAAAAGMPYAVRTYESNKGRAEVESFYDAWMKARGWIRAAKVESEGASAYFRQDGYQVFLVLAEEESRTYATLIEAGASGSSPIAAVEVTETP
jgi:hypothetical protein